MSIRDNLETESARFPVPLLSGPVIRGKRSSRLAWKRPMAIGVALLTIVLVALVFVKRDGSNERLAGPEAKPILDSADRLASSNGGKAVHVDAVRTTRVQAESLIGEHTGGEAQGVVWVAQAFGDHYSCEGCDHPPGAPKIEADYITLVLADGSWVVSDSGLQNKPLDLAALGTVERLR